MSTDPAQLLQDGEVVHFCGFGEHVQSNRTDKHATHTDTDSEDDQTGKLVRDFFHDRFSV